MRNKRTSKAMISIALLSLLTILSACGSKAVNGNAGSSASASSSATTASKPQSTEISYLTWTEKDESLLKDFQTKYSGIKVNEQNMAGVSEYLQSQKVRMLSGDVDVTSIRPETLVDYAKAGDLLDLTGQDFVNNVNPSTLTKATVDGKVYAVPESVNLIGVWYNKTLFNKYNIAVPKTWDAFLEACDTLKKNNVVPMANGGKDAWPMEFDVYPFIHKLLVDDPDIFSKIDKGEAKYTDQAFVDTFKAIQDFYKKGYIHKDVLSLTYAQASDLFLQQKIGMIIQGDWFSQTFAGKKVDFNYGVFTLPIPGEADKVVVPVSVGMYEAVVKNSKHKEAALDFVKYLSSPEGASFITKSFISPVKGAQLPEGSLLKLWEPYLQASSVDFFYSLQSPAANAEMTKGLQELYLGAVTPEQLAANIQAAQDKKGE